MRPKLIILSLIFSLIILFRGNIYRTVIEYQSIGKRAEISIENTLLISKINNLIIKNKPKNIHSCIETSLELCNDILCFSSQAKSSNPNKLVDLHKSHCVGYASFFSSTLNYVLKQSNLSDTWAVNHEKGQLFLLGYNIHNFTSSSFFKDHDFVLIENKFTHEKIGVDPSLNDYFCINHIKLKEQ